MIIKSYIFWLAAFSQRPNSGGRASVVEDLPADAVVISATGHNGSIALFYETAGAPEAATRPRTFVAVRTGEPFTARPNERLRFITTIKENGVSTAFHLYESVPY